MYINIHNGTVLDDERELGDEFDDLLDTLYDAFHIGDVTIYPAAALKGGDPIAYRVALSDYASTDYVDTDDLPDDTPTLLETDAYGDCEHCGASTDILLYDPSTSRHDLAWVCEDDTPEGARTYAR